MNSTKMRAKRIKLGEVQLRSFFAKLNYALLHHLLIMKQYSLYLLNNALGFLFWINSQSKNVQVTQKMVHSNTILIFSLLNKRLHSLKQNHEIQTIWFYFNQWNVTKQDCKVVLQDDQKLNLLCKPQLVKFIKQLYKNQEIQKQMIKTSFPQISQRFMNNVQNLIHSQRNDSKEKEQIILSQIHQKWNMRIQKVERRDKKISYLQYGKKRILIFWDLLLRRHQVILYIKFITLFFVANYLKNIIQIESCNFCFQSCKPNIGIRIFIILLLTIVHSSLRSSILQELWRLLLNYSRKHQEETFLCVILFRKQLDLNFLMCFLQNPIAYSIYLPRLELFQKAYGQNRYMIRLRAYQSCFKFKSP
ncbi:unnamed protein product [Paramecium primaurelia]|uniref:Transmembrane protein n=1 Tax=Paramecium primaurelia TaxID=5886 RepID=A0A8S1QRP6_PARPR|nr:unnamed protein product [Paramecium primaurelia]